MDETVESDTKKKINKPEEKLKYQRKKQTKKNNTPLKSANNILKKTSYYCSTDTFSLVSYSSMPLFCKGAFFLHNTINRRKLQTK